REPVGEEDVNRLRLALGADRLIEIDDAPERVSGGDELPDRRVVLYDPRAVRAHRGEEVTGAVGAPEGEEGGGVEGRRARADSGDRPPAAPWRPRHVGDRGRRLLPLHPLVVEDDDPRVDGEADPAVRGIDELAWNWPRAGGAERHRKPREREIKSRERRDPPEQIDLPCARLGLERREELLTQRFPIDRVDLDAALLREGL